MKLFSGIMKTLISVFFTGICHYGKMRKRHQNRSLTYWKITKTKIKNNLLCIGYQLHEKKTT